MNIFLSGGKPLYTSDESFEERHIVNLIDDCGYGLWSVEAGAELRRTR